MKEEKESKDESSEEGEVKVPEQFQKDAIALVKSCKTMACLDFLSSEVNECRNKMYDEKHKNDKTFSKAEMPSIH